MKEGWSVWLTGLPGSGKSTIAVALQVKLKKNNINSQILSSDELRKVITPNPKYTEEERDVVYNAINYLADLLNKNGINVIIDATGNRRKYREKARQGLKKFREIYLKCNLAVCIDREKRREDTHGAPKGIYEKALKGNSKVPGFGTPYEEPENADLKLNTEVLSSEICVDKIYDFILQNLNE